MIISKNRIEHAFETIKKGGIIIYPTDTLFGLGADATNTIAIEKINALKKRKTPLSIMIQSVQYINMYANISDNTLNYLKTIFPGPYTALLKSKKHNLSNLVQCDSKKIGIRIPKNNFCLKLLKKFKKPIITTSVNVHGSASLNDINKIESNFPDINIYYGNINKKSNGSTIIDFTEFPHKLIRKGDGIFK